MNIKTLQAFHRILVGLLDSDVLSAGFGYEVEDLEVMKAEVETLIKEEQEYLTDNSIFDVDVPVNTKEMARIGWTGQVVDLRIRANGRKELNVRWTCKPNERFDSWLYPIASGVYWWGGYRLYVDYQQLTDSEECYGKDNV